MNITELAIGDYVVIQFGPAASVQLAEIKRLDLDRNEASILPECQSEEILISTPDQWNQIQPLPIVCQILLAFGFSDISLEKAYGWTAKYWSKVSLDRRHIFNLSYDNNMWSLEINSIVNGVPHTITHHDIIYVHQLQHLLMPYNPVF